MKQLNMLLLTLMVLALTACSRPEYSRPTTPETTTMQATTEAATQEATETAAAAFAPDFSFCAEDLDGNVYTEAVFAENNLTILNFWEPWCGPCVSEMPSLQKISEDYADQGVLILGIYATPDAEADVAAVLENTGVTYPILHYTKDFDHLQTGYVPNTVVVDSTGAIVRGPFAGALNHAGWVSLIEEYL